MKKVPLWANNNSKEDSRALITSIIKDNIKSNINMFELLGEGVGAKYYDSNLNIDYMALIENKIVLIDSFENECLTMGTRVVDLYQLQAYKFFDKIYSRDFNKYFFNVINLDFCAWFYDNEKSNCTAQIINKMFESKALMSGGLLFLTLQIEGQNLDRNRLSYKTKFNRDIPCTINEIEMSIAFYAALNKYRLSERVLTNQYKAGSRRGCQMLNLGFKVEKI